VSFVLKFKQSNAHTAFDGAVGPYLDQSSAARNQRPQKWFEVLEVAPAASLEEIKAAYRSKISSYHPDRVASLGWEFRKLAEERSKMINEAYSTATRLRSK
jgi:DnaJ-domain-containing protein 1